MAFMVQQVDGGRVPGIEYLPCGAIIPKVGMALIQSGGNLAIATGSNAPTYVSMIERRPPARRGTSFPLCACCPI